MYKRDRNLIELFRYKYPKYDDLENIIKVTKDEIHIHSLDAISTIPDHTVYIIFNYLDINSIMKLGLTCHKYYKYIHPKADDTGVHRYWKTRMKLEFWQVPVIDLEHLVFYQYLWITNHYTKVGRCVKGSPFNLRHFARFYQTYNHTKHINEEVAGITSYDRVCSSKVEGVLFNPCDLDKTIYKYVTTPNTFIPDKKMVVYDYMKKVFKKRMARLKEEGLLSDKYIWEVLHDALEDGLDELARSVNLRLVNCQYRHGWDRVAESFRDLIHEAI